MTEPDVLNPQDRTMLDLVSLERSGASFELSLADSKLYIKDRLYFERKKIINNKNRLMVIIFQCLLFCIFIGVLASSFCIVVIYADDILGKQGALVAGLVLGGTASGLLFTMFIIGALRYLNHQLSSSGTKTSRAGVDRDILWMSDGKALRFILAASAFTEVIQIEDLIAAYIDPSRYYLFPREALSRTIQGQKVIEWFESNWPRHTGENAYRYEIPQRNFLQQNFNRFCKILIYCIIPVLILWMAVLVQSWLHG